MTFYLFYLNSIKFQIEQKSKWTEDAVLKKLKQNYEPKKANWQRNTGSNEMVTNYWQRSGRRLSEELVQGCYDARRKNFEVRHLTDSELNFLLEYVCNSWSLILDNFLQSFIFLYYQNVSQNSQNKRSKINEVENYTVHCVFSLLQMLQIMRYLTR